VKNPVGVVMVSETKRDGAPPRSAAWSAAILGLHACSGLALIVVPLWAGGRSIGSGAAGPLVLWVRISVKESPRYEHVTTAMLKEGLKKRFDISRPCANIRVRCWSRRWSISHLFT
jgi:hypothetical protein